MSRSLLVLASFAALCAPLTGCALTTHETRPAALGVARSSADMAAVLDTPGTVEVQSVAAADWAVPLSGLVNLDNPRARAAGLVDHDEPMTIYFYALRHPDKGLWLVDTGVEKALRDAPDQAAIHGLVASVAHTEKLKYRNVLSEWIGAQKTPVQGVFFTHLHVDHISGLRDVPHGARLFAGPGEAADTAFQNLFLRGTTDLAFEGQAALEEWQFGADPTGRFAGVLDVFGDQQVWALYVPGHTLGSTAYVVRTPAGPVMMTGDTCHTVWGWNNVVEPGDFTADHEANAMNLARLEGLAKEHPKMKVYLGHQRLPGTE